MVNLWFFIDNSNHTYVGRFSNGKLASPVYPQSTLIIIYQLSLFFLLQLNVYHYRLHIAVEYVA